MTHYNNWGEIPEGLQKSIAIDFYYSKASLTISDAIVKAASLIESLIPKPINEAPKDGTDFIGIGNVFGIARRGIFIIILNIRRDKWYEENGMNYDPEYLTHFIPLSAIQKLME